MAFGNWFVCSGGLCGEGRFSSLTDYTQYGGNINTGAFLWDGTIDGVGKHMGGIDFDFSSMQVGGWYDIFIVDISDNPKTQLVLRGECRGGNDWRRFTYDVYKRIYDDPTDPTVYNDYRQNFIPNTMDIAYYPSGVGSSDVRTTALYGVLTTITYNGVQYIAAGILNSFRDNASPKISWVTRFVSYASFKTWAGELPEDEDFSPDFGPGAKPKGGYNKKSQKKGTFDDHSDKIIPTGVPTEGICSSGFIHVYRCSAEVLESLGDQLFPAPQSPLDLVELIRNRFDMDYIIGCKLVPLRPQYNPNALGNIIVGYHRFIAARYAYTVTSDYVEKDLGSIGWSEYWANFLDYSGTTAQLFLPFLGFVPIEPEFWNGGGMIHLIFRMNCITGDFVYLIRSSSSMSELDDSLIAQYGGNCSVEIPVTGVQGGQAFLNFGMSVAQIGNGLHTDSFSGVASGVNRLCGIRPDVPKSGGITSSSGFFGHRRPFLLIKRQESQFSEKYPEEVGLPLYSMKRLGDCTGLTIAKDAHLDTIPADVEVKAKINQLLAEGVIL